MQFPLTARVVPILFSWSLLDPLPLTGGEVEVEGRLLMTSLDSVLMTTRGSTDEVGAPVPFMVPFIPTPEASENGGQKVKMEYFLEI